jgi:hypothetical protein
LESEIEHKISNWHSQLVHKLVHRACLRSASWQGQQRRLGPPCGPKTQADTSPRSSNEIRPRSHRRLTACCVPTAKCQARVVGYHSRLLWRCPRRIQRPRANACRRGDIALAS